MAAHRSYFLKSALFVGLILLSFFLTLPVQAAHSLDGVYVNDTGTVGDSWHISRIGSDTHAGTGPDTPVRTLQKALAIAQPDSPILIGAGVFSETLPIELNGFRIAGSGETGTIGPGGDTGTILRGTGNGDSGIRINQAENLTIELLRVQDFSSHGLVADGDKNNKLRRVRFLNNGGKGMLFQNSTGDTVRNVRVEGSANDGIALFDSERLTIERTVSRGSNGLGSTGRGLLLDNANGVTIRRSRSLDNEEAGVQLIDADTGVYKRNLITGNAEGMVIDNSGRLFFALNEFRNGSGDDELTINGPDSSFDTFVHNNFLNLSNSSEIINNTTTEFIKRLNYWNSSDSASVEAVISGDIKYIPYRLSTIDTQATQFEDRAAPAAPSDFSADTSVTNEIKLSWTTPSNFQDGSGGVSFKEYRIYRSTDPNETDWKTNSDSVFRIRNTSDTTFTDTSVTSTQTYYYRITAFDSHTRDSRVFESESYFSRIIGASPEEFGPKIYVNDDTTAGDVFTDRTGDDSKNGTPQHPLRTLSFANTVSEPGDTIFVDAGTYTDTATIDTDAVDVVGAGINKTVFDVNSAGTAIRLTQESSSSPFEGNKVKNLSIRDAVTGVALDGAQESHLMNLEVKGSTIGIVSKSNANKITNNLLSENQVGLQLSGADANLVTQNEFDSNRGYQIEVDATGVEIRRNNIFTSATWPDSGIRQSSVPDATFNWWDTTDSTVVRVRSDTSDYIPHRLGPVDTGVGADSVAPKIDTTAIDTGTAKEISLSWSQPSDDEDNSSLSGVAGYRIYRLKNVSDTVDWTKHLLKEITDPGQTTYTDTAIEKQQGYFYRVTAFDAHSIENESYFTRVRSGTWVNRIPIANSARLLTQRDSPVTFTLTGSDSDGDALRFFIEENGDDGDSLVLPSNGSLDTSAFSPSNPKLTYSSDTSFAGTDTFTFVVRDPDTVSDTAVVSLEVLVEQNTRVKSFRTGASDTPAEAGSGGTIPVRMLYENTKTGPGEVLRDTDHITIRNALGRNVTDSFNVSLSGTDVRVNSNDTAVGEMGSEVPSPSNEALVGNFRVSYNVDTVVTRSVLTKDTRPLGDSIPGANRRTFNVVPRAVKVKATASDSGVDTFSVDVQTTRLRGGIVDSLSALDGDSLADGDSVFTMIQRGGTEAIDTPIANPAYKFRTADTFDIRMRNAYDTLLTQDFPNQDEDFTRNLQILPDNLLLISLWRNAIFGEYLGNSEQLNERSTVVVKDVGFRGPAERLSVVKLKPSDYSWVVVDKLNDVNDVTGSEGDYTVRFDVSPDVNEDGSGFSVFQIIATGVADIGSSDEAIAYPNPFVPFDGNSETGEYGSGPNQGIYFGAGKNRGFPAGTRLEIYNIKGEHIAEFSLNSGGILQWDARTGNGDPVASGVYVFRVETPNGEQKIGKFAVVR